MMLYEYERYVFINRKLPVWFGLVRFGLFFKPNRTETIRFGFPIEPNRKPNRKPDQTENQTEKTEPYGTLGQRYRVF